jgi:tetratricopeptide (TPR) repeat protein
MIFQVEDAQLGGCDRGLTAGSSLGNGEAQPLLERDDELVELDRLLADARGARGRVALIEGPAGIGKTRLLQEARERASANGMTVLTARGGELERDFGFGVVRQLFEPELSRVAAPERRQLLAGAAGLAEPVFAVRADAQGDGGDPPHGVLHGLYWLVVNLSERAPLLVAIDDAHWSDGASLRFLIHLARRLDGLPVVIALATRTGEDSGQPELLRGLVLEARPPILRPKELSEGAVSTVVVATLGDGAGPMLCSACHEATAGNPFLVTELLEELRHDDRPPSEISPAAIGRLASDRISASVLLRVGRLDRAAPGFARSVAVLGAQAGLTDAAALAGLDAAKARSLAASLADSAVLAPGEPLRFVHPILRTAVYEEIPADSRAAMHAHAARLLGAAGAEPESVALHLLATDPSDDRETVERLRSAATDAQARGAPETALRYLRRALLEPPTDGERAGTALELGVAGAQAGAPDTLELLRQSLRLASDPQSCAIAAIELGLAAFGHGRMDECADSFERGLAGVGDSRPDLAAQLEAMLLLIGVSTPKLHARIGERLAAAYAKIEQLPAPAARPLCVSLCFDTALCGKTAGNAAGLAERALGDGALLREHTAHSTLVYPPAWVLIYTDRLAVAEQALTDSFDDASGRGSVHGLVLSSGFRSAARYWRGNLSGAEADARTALELAADAGFTQYSPLALATLVGVLIERGETGAAGEALEETEWTSEDPDGPPGGAALRESRALLHASLGNNEAALSELAAIRHWEQAYGATSGVAQVRWRARAALVHRAMGNDQEALRLAREQVELAQRF